MQLGWIDFSKNDRKEVLNVLDLLGEDGILDELGIAPIRDYFSDLFFPGISTNQTRAKYFFIVPYILKDFESPDFNDSFKEHPETINFKKVISDIEENYAHELLDKNSNERGIIGKIAISNGRWVNRTPADIYWSGLWKYGFIVNNFDKDKHLSIENCIKEIISQKTDGTEGNDDAIKRGVSLNMGTYTEDWPGNPDIRLTCEEGKFLRNMIASTCEDNLIGLIVKDEDCFNVFEYKSFYDLRAIIKNFPEKMQNEYRKAISFSEFVFALRVIYNIVVSCGNNEEANEEFKNLDLKEVSKIDVLDIVPSNIKEKNPKIVKFLVESRELMENNEIERLKECIKSREISLKNNKAKSLHPGEFDWEMWYGGGRLDYRFQNAKTILKDIHDSKYYSKEVIEDVESE